MYQLDNTNQIDHPLSLVISFEIYYSKMIKLIRIRYYSQYPLFVWPSKMKICLHMLYALTQLSV